MIIRSALRYLLLPAFIIGLVLTNHAAEVVYYTSPATNMIDFQALRLACGFYGVELNTTTNCNASVLGTAEILVIDASVLDTIKPGVVADDAVVLISGINETTSTRALSDWSEGHITGAYGACSHKPDSAILVTEQRPDITQELSGQSLPMDIQFGFGLRSSNQGSALLTYNDKTPLLVLLRDASNPRWFLAACAPIISPEADIWFYDYGFFAEIAPYMLFIKNSLREFIWHSNGQYANLTIDDPWLREPYGPLSYTALLQEMDKAGYHTTIAFIPWNYDRPSSPEVIDLFLNRPDRYSLCVHGNNNDHREFYRYEERPDNQWAAKPLEVQEQNIRQALARMHAFEKETKIPFDKVMVFPHLIGPAPTLQLLRKYNFLATSNAGYVPLDETMPRDPLFWLRRATTDFYGLASLDRSEPRNRSEADIAIDLFLDNPLLFVEHIPYFRERIDAFNPVAETVNRIAPDVQWCSLGTILQNLYLQRRTGDAEWDVWSFSPDILLSNSSDTVMLYNIHRADDESIPVDTVCLDQELLAYSISNGHLHTTVELDPGEAVRIDTQYLNDLKLEEISLEKTNTKYNALRTLAEFRDLRLSSGATGYIIDRYYYKTGLYEYGMKGLLMAGLFGLFVLIMTVRFFRRRGMQQ